MSLSTISENGQTTIPEEVRKTLNLKPNQTIQWEIQPDGSVNVRPQFSAMELFGSLKSNVPFPGFKEEEEAVERAIAEQAAKEGLET